MQQRKYCLKRDPDNRKREIGEHIFTLSRAPMPPVVDLRSKCPELYDQGSLGSCTANAIGSAYQMTAMEQARVNIRPSRLFIYYNERKMENTIAEDCGACISDGVLSTHNTGVVDEREWPYEVSKFAVEPPQECYEHAKHHTTNQFKSITQSLPQLKTCLIEGHPIVLGISLYKSFESVGANGLVAMPKRGDDFLGGHAVLCVGYDDNKHHFIMRNSWGDSWGDKGYFYLPYEYLLDHNLASDFWAILSVNEGH
jgi:C1A family cysteine protease